MGIIFLMLLGIGLIVFGLFAFLYSSHKENSIFCFTSGSILLMLPMVLIVDELAGTLSFFGSFYFLIPAWRAYQTYQEYKNRSVWSL